MFTLFQKPKCTTSQGPYQSPYRTASYWASPFHGKTSKFLPLCTSRSLDLTAVQCTRRVAIRHSRSPIQPWNSESQEETLVRNLQIFFRDKSHTVHASTGNHRGRSAAQLSSGNNPFRSAARDQAALRGTRSTRCNRYCYPRLIWKLPHMRIGKPLVASW